MAEPARARAAEGAFEQGALGTPNERSEDERRKHAWRRLALGRVCDRCGITQLTGEFDDAIACIAP
jgi:hypothetical protein